MKLQTKFLVILFPLVVVPLLLNSYITRQHFAEMMGESVAQQNNILKQQMLWNLDIARQDSIGLVAEILSYPDLKNAFDQLQEQPELLQSRLEQFQQHHPKLQYVEVLSERGTSLARVQAAAAIGLPATLPPSDILRLFHADHHLYMLESHRQPADADVAPGLSIRTLVRLQQMETFIQTTRRSSNILLLLLDHGNVLSEESALKKLLPIQGDTGGNQLQWNSNHYLVNRTNITPNLQMVTLTPTVDMEASNEALNKVLSYVAIASGLISLLILHRSIATLVTNPLQRFQALTLNIINGNFKPVKVMQRQDELGLLSQSMETMRQHLQDTSEHIEELAYFDPLTGLPNKVSFIDTIQHLIEKSQVSGHQLAILFFDLDNFKHINDGLGHEFGDEMLMQVSNRLKECIRSHDVIAPGNHLALQDAEEVIARLGGDEFTLVLSKINSPDEAAKVATRILHKLSKPFLLQDNDVFISASIGISMYPKDGRTPEDLLKNADTAMYAAKSSGKNHSRFYDSKMNKPVLERIELEASMRSALANNEFILYYQPKVPLFGETRFEFETLMRWNHSEKGMISPGLFIPLAEDSGYIQTLGDWAIEQTCRQIEYWNRKGYKNVTVSTNLSPVQLNYGNPLDTIKQALASFDIRPEQLEIEITESGLMQNEKHAVELLNDIKSLGVRIALDDFGTGYSSLAYLLKFPIDTLKIDRAFIRDIDSHPESLKVLESIIGLAKSLDLHVVAEGVETREQLDLLQARECNYIQGFYFARPTEPDEAMAFFEGHYTADTEIKDNNPVRKAVS
ncbi:MAG: EAL domain-containing protein [Pseudomonadota bacterium]|nr:EAL domain-containing protein [Pseudomonadota bacterium]